MQYRQGQRHAIHLQGSKYLLQCIFFLLNHWTLASYHISSDAKWMSVFYAVQTLNKAFISASYQLDPYRMHDFFWLM